MVQPSCQIVQILTSNLNITKLTAILSFSISFITKSVLGFGFKENLSFKFISVVQSMCSAVNCFLWQNWLCSFGRPPTSQSCNPCFLVLRKVIFLTPKVGNHAQEWTKEGKKNMTLLYGNQGLKNKFAITSRKA